MCHKSKKLRSNNGKWGTSVGVSFMLQDTY